LILLLYFSFALCGVLKVTQALDTQHHADEMAPGTFFFCLTKRLPSVNWTVLEFERHPMSWGEATVYIHQRK
jgi:hypothetical protein